MAKKLKRCLCECKWRVITCCCGLQLWFLITQRPYIRPFICDCNFPYFSIYMQFATFCFKKTIRSLSLINCILFSILRSHFLKETRNSSYLLPIICNTGNLRIVAFLCREIEMIGMIADYLFILWYLWPIKIDENALADDEWNSWLYARFS